MAKHAFASPTVNDFCRCVDEQYTELASEGLCFVHLLCKPFVVIDMELHHFVTISGSEVKACIIRHVLAVS